MNWEIMRSTLHLLSMISMLLTKNIKRWDVSASKIHLWEFILLKILTDTGWKLYRANKKSLKKGISITDSFFVLISYIICNTYRTYLNRYSCLLCFDHLSSANVNRYMPRCPTDISRLRIAYNCSCCKNSSTCSWN